MSRAFSEPQLAGARSLIEEGLGLSTGLPLLVLYEDILRDAARCVKAAAETLGVPAELQGFSTKEFSAIHRGDAVRRLIPEYPRPRGIALLVDWSEETTEARLALLEALSELAEPWRVASMPGVDLDGLANCVTDFQAIEDDCRAIFAVLARSRTVTLETADPQGKVDSLLIRLTRRYWPITSTGKISPNTWGNFPSGETFAIPAPHSAHGWVTLRGSIPRRPLEPGEWVRFELRRGRIQYESVAATSQDLLQYFLSLFFTRSGSVKGRNTNALAELGVGTNPNILHLTGKPIFDEKMAGTVHIAFGRNVQFGGPLASSVHHDLVCSGLTLRADAPAPNGCQRHMEIVRDGVLILRAENAIPLLRHVSDAPRIRGHLTPSRRVEYHISRSGRDTDKLLLTYSSRRSNVEFPIAYGVDADVASKLLEYVHANTKVSMSELIRANLAPSGQIRSLVRGLLYYGLLGSHRMPSQR